MRVMRLIDAEELWTDITREIEDCSDVLEIIERQPTIDTSKNLLCTINVNMDTDEVIERIKERGWEPVEHGHWIKIGEIDKDGNQYYQCSKCGKGEIHVPIIDVKYCWSCGARMDEEADHDDHL